MKKLLAFLLAAVLCLTCFAACGKKKTETPDEGSKPTQLVYDVDDAAAYLKNMYKKYLTANETPADYTLVSQVMKGGVIYKITWTVDNDGIKVIVDEENKQVKIDLDEKTKVDIAYKLTATITDPDGKTTTLSFDLKVPKYVLSSWKDYMAAEAGKAVVVEGYVAAVHAPSEGNKYNTLYLHDVNNAGGYYVYSMASDKDLVKDLGIKKGMLVSVAGIKDIYSGTHEIKDASVTILDETVVDFAPVDITNLYKNATSLKDTALTDKLAMLVTIKGVEITDQDLSEKSMYMNFKLAGLESYIRVYATDCPASVSDAGQQKIIDEHGKKKGYYADVTGVVVMYSGAIYLNPVSDNPFKYGAFINRTDAEKVQYEMDEVKFDTKITLNKSLKLPSKGATYEDVKITWTSSNEDYITIKDGKAVITLGDEATTASITGTFTLGTVTKTKTITFNLAAKPSVVPQTVLNPVAGTAYKLFFTQAAKGEFRYFTGNMSGYYGESTLDFNAAVDMFVEPAGNGYYMYFNNGGEKNYINITVSGTHVNFVFQTEKPAVPFSIDAENNNAPYMTVTVTGDNGTQDKPYHIGTYGDYVTFGTSDASKAATSYVATLCTMVDTSSIPDADKVAAEKNSLTVEDEFFAAAEVTLPTKGSNFSEVAISWASNSEYAVVNGNKLNITLPTATTKVTLTATLTCGSATDTKTFDVTITVVSTEAFAPTFAGIRPEEGKAYKLAIYQANLGKWLYADGTFGDKYLNTTENYDEGADYYAELVSTDVYKFYILEGTTKKYLTFYLDASNKTRVKFDAAGTTQFTYDVTTNAWVTNFDGKDRYLGTYNSFDTLSVSETSYIDANKTGVSQFPANPVSLTITETALKADTAYKFAFFQGDASVNKMLYILDTIDTAKNRYINTTANPAEAVDVYVEEATGGFRFYILEGTTKKYITAYLNGENKTSLKFDAAGTSVFYFNSTTNAWVTTLDGAEYYMGTYSTFETVSLSATSYINADKTGVSQFPLNLVAVKFSGSSTGGNEGGNQGGNEGGNEGGSTTTPTTMPYTVGKEYVMQLYQANNQKNLYLNGEMSTYYFATVEDVASAVKVVMEADGDGYQLYFMNGSVKTYLTVVPNGTHNNTTFVTEKPSVAWKWNGTLSTLTLTISSGEFFLGTYGTHSTISACAISYADNFKALLVDPATIEGGSGNQGGNTGSGNEGGNTGSGNEGSGNQGGAVTGTPVVFTFGDNGDAAHVDGNDIGAEKAYTSGSYTLTLTSVTKVYDGAFDAKGNSCLKLGTSKSGGTATFTFTVPADVTSVTIKVAGYKAKTGSITVNGSSYSITTQSNNGAYTDIVIDTTTTKTIVFATTGSTNTQRVMIDSITFNVG